jgi:hypothetical protein
MADILPPETVAELARRTAQQVTELRALFPTGTRPLVDPGPVSDLVRQIHEQMTAAAVAEAEHMRRTGQLEGKVDGMDAEMTEVRGAFKLVGRLLFALIFMFLAAMALGAVLALRTGAAPHP